MPSQSVDHQLMLVVVLVELSAELPMLTVH
jgi:hypothetical protein